MDTHVVIGLGEIGKAIFSILSEGQKTVVGIDVDYELEGEYDFLHICIPYKLDGSEFIDTVKGYKEKFKGMLVIHSTVPVGTCRKLDAIHSPVIGKHPDLIRGIRTFVKYFSGSGAIAAATEFGDVGLETEVLDNQEDTEAAKLWSTTQFGFFILLNKEIKKWCDENNVDFDFVYKHWNENYNKGYQELGYPQFTRPVLEHVSGKIGGHCVTPNCDLLGGWVAETILKRVSKNDD